MRFSEQFAANTFSGARKDAYMLNAVMSVVSEIPFRQFAFGRKLWRMCHRPKGPALVRSFPYPPEPDRDSGGRSGIPEIPLPPCKLPRARCTGHRLTLRLGNSPPVG